MNIYANEIEKYLLYLNNTVLHSQGKNQTCLGKMCTPLSQTFFKIQKGSEYACGQWMLLWKRISPAAGSLDLAWSCIENVLMVFGRVDP